MKVQCPGCKKLCHKTTETYDPDIRANGGMVELLKPWKSWGWGKFGDHRDAGAEILASDMQCPCCETPLAPSGRLTVVSDDYDKSRAEKGTKQVMGIFAARTPCIEEPAKLTTKAESIQALLKNGDYTYSEIAKKVGTSAQYVRNIAGKMKE